MYVRGMSLKGMYVRVTGIPVFVTATTMPPQCLRGPSPAVLLTLTITSLLALPQV